MELTWQLPAPDAVTLLGARLNDHFFDGLCTNDPEAFHHIFGYVLNVAPHTRDAVKCIRHLVRSSHYDIRFSRQVLLRLCEIDPDHWTQQFSLLRDSMYAFFEDIRITGSLESMVAAQNDLAQDIFGVTGFDRFLEGLSDLYFVKDGPVGVPSDNWYWRSLSERRRLVLIHYIADTGELGLSPHTNPNERRPLPSPLISIHAPPSIGDGILTARPASRPDDERKMADDFLGSNLLAPVGMAA